MNPAAWSAIGVVLAAVIALWGSRFTVKSARRATNEDRDAVWNAAYRNAVEPHLLWDNDRIFDCRQLRDAVNRLEKDRGLDLTVWATIPPPPPLFPNLGPGK